MKKVFLITVSHIMTLKQGLSSEIKYSNLVFSETRGKERGM